MMKLKKNQETMPLQNAIKASILKNTTSYHEELIESLRDPEEAAIYLKVALEEYEKDNDTEVFLLALRHVAEARNTIKS